MIRPNLFGIFLTFILSKTVANTGQEQCLKNAKIREQEINCMYKFKKNWSLKNIFVRATAPEGNLTQGEIVFEEVTDKNGRKILKFKTGFGVDVLNSLQISLGFSIKVITAKGWATQFSNLSWFGMAQQIIDGEADLSLAKTSILPNRAKDLGYLVPTHGLGLYAFFVQPVSKSGRNIFLEPFNVWLWIYFVSFYIVLIISLKILAYLSPQNSLEDEDKILREEAGIWGFHAICQHGFHSPPKLFCLRVALLTGVFLGLICYTSYSAQLVSIFSIATVPIKSMGDLLKSSINIVVDENNQRARNMIEESSQKADPISLLLKAHIKLQQKIKPLASTAAGGSSVLKGEGAFVTFKDTFYTTIKNTFGTVDSEFCAKVSTVPVTNGRFMSGLFVKKGGKLKEPFNVKLIAMYNCGLMSRFVSKYEETYTPACYQLGAEQAKGAPIIMMGDVLILFYAFGAGILISLGICCGEFLYFAILRRNENVKVVSKSRNKFKRFC